MGIFKITISYLAPYPIEKRYEENASSFAPAISRAIKKWRKEAKGKKIKELTIKTIKL